MLLNYIKIAWRALLKRKFYTLLNVSGLALAITCSMLIYLYTSYHLSFDGYHKKASRTYRVVNDILFDQTIHDPGASLGIYKALTSGISQLDQAAIMLRNYTFTITVNEVSESPQRYKDDKAVSFVSEEWFKLFDYNWLAGSPNELKKPNTVALSEKLAKKYFGDKNPIGKILVFENRQPLTIIGLISDKTTNTDLKAGMFVSLSSLANLKPDLPSKFYTDWGWINSTTSVYLSLKDPGEKAAVESIIRGMAKTYMPTNWKFYRFKLQPLKDVHFDTAYGASTEKSLLITLGIVALVILAIAGINYVNLSIAQHARRSIEIGTRKALGSTTKQLFTQFLVETAVTTSLAMLLATMLTLLLLPVANHYILNAEPLSIVSYTQLTAFLIFLFVVLVLLSGFYPSLLLSRVPIANALKNETPGLQAGLLRKVLMVFQNSVAQTLIVCALIIILQVRLLTHTDKGFSRDAVLLVTLPADSTLKRSLLHDRLAKLPQVESFTFCHKAPSSGNYGGGSVRFDNREWEKWPVGSRIGDSSYVRTFGLQLIAGRNLREMKSGREYLINENMISKLGLKNPEQVLGKMLVNGELDDDQGRIVGVVKNFNIESLKNPMGPVLITSYPKRYSIVGLKLKTLNFPEAIQAVRKCYEDTFPAEVFDYQFFDEEVAGLYKKESLQEKIVWATTTVAVCISCLGMLGLISLITLQRTKEVCIRKVMGASVSGIVAMLSSDLLKLVLVAMTVAFPIAYWAMSNWLDNFAHRVNIEFWMFLMSGVASLVIALITVSFQTVKAAIANPVKSLRTE